MVVTAIWEAGRCWSVLRWRVPCEGSRLKQERLPSWTDALATAAGFLRQERYPVFIGQLAEAGMSPWTTPVETLTGADILSPFSTASGWKGEPDYPEVGRRTGIEPLQILAACYSRARHSSGLPDIWGKVLCHRPGRWGKGDTVASSRPPQLGAGPLRLEAEHGFHLNGRRRWGDGGGELGDVRLSRMPRLQSVSTVTSEASIRQPSQPQQ